ncbi:lipoyl(octanoyl) transferase LipB [Cellulomonas sp. IC4_254]|uniref:lipoyl(octanoyl) transferase LipB n=1 Tax=Cellulomonas sp. IC4_254 TaxID=2714040 RepID=UPI001421089F|nr:lipoyl(octanoyl) transferase LipB [Cellulomonas sp. IC4_254]NHT16797.1 lipoyl(octanoyl) transferase LipB [Cellulomonas sp. IC4_254]
MIAVVDRGLDGPPLDFHEGWRLQRALHAEVVAGDRPGALLLCQHAPVYTAGRRTRRDERPADPGGTPVVDVDRGGKITWHGPGQLVGYPVVRLREPVDVVAYVRALEGALIAVAAGYGVRTERVEGRSGVWVPPASGVGPAAKIAAIGVRVAAGVTMHGFALNVANDLAPYDRIVPCGIADAGVTTLSREAGRALTPREVLPAVVAALADALPAVADVPAVAGVAAVAGVPAATEAAA